MQASYWGLRLQQLNVEAATQNTLPRNSKHPEDLRCTVLFCMRATKFMDHLGLAKDATVVVASLLIHRLFARAGLSK